MAKIKSNIGMAFKERQRIEHKINKRIKALIRLLKDNNAYASFFNHVKHLNYECVRGDSFKHVLRKYIGSNSFQGIIGYLFSWPMGEVTFWSDLNYKYGKLCKEKNIK